jgi:hypothetical protein
LVLSIIKNRHLCRALSIFSLVGMILAGCAALPDWRNSGINYPVRIVWNDTRWCVPLQLKFVLANVSQRFGTVTVHSTHRWPLENRRKGGKKRSYHLTCRAVDFSVGGDRSEVVDYLVRQRGVGGYSYYDKGFYHIDTGPRRTW